MNLRLGRAFGKSGLAPTLLMLRDRWNVSPWITVLSYHRAACDRAATEYDEGVIDVSAEMFEQHLTSLEHWCNPISLDQVRAFVAGAKLPRNPVLITFDDGYRDNHDVILPILQRHRMPAAFFVATSYVEQRRLFWWDRINLLVKTSRKEVLELDYPRALTLPLAASTGHRAAAIGLLLRVVKDHYALDLERFLEHVAVAADVNIPPHEERRRADALVMTWNQVRALRRAGMDVQSHTSTHRVLQTLTPDALSEELSGSREMLEEVLGEPVRSISYPVGKAIGPMPHIREAVRAAGYDLGFSNCTGVNWARRFDPLDARRLPADSAASGSELQSMIALPCLGW